MRHLLSAVLVLSLLATGFAGAADLPWIGPGGRISIDIEGHESTWCTAGFVFTDGATLYLSTAGHCLLPSGATSTHGADADFDVSRIRVEMQGTLLGPVRYARQTNASALAPLGNDFGVIEIPAELSAQTYRSLPWWGGPEQEEPVLPEPTSLLCIYGQGSMIVRTSGTRADTQAKSGTWNPTNDPESGFWGGHVHSTFGDSGSPTVTCTPDEAGRLRGRAPVGILTHGSQVQGVIAVGLAGASGTTLARSQEMAREAGLELQLVI